MNPSRAPANDVPPPFFRFIYDAKENKFQVTAHAEASPDDTGALFGVLLTPSDVLEIIADWTAHIERRNSFCGSLPATKGK